MKTKIISFIAGLVFGGLLAGLVALYYARNQFSAGTNSGKILANQEFLRQVEIILGNDYLPSDGYHTFLEVKDSAVLVVERNGIKTLRPYFQSSPDAQKATPPTH